jgi:hypothetical protein
VNGITVGSSQDAATTVPRLFQEPCDLGMTPIARHDDQAAVIHSVPFRIGAGVEQELHRFEVSLPHGEMNRRRVPILGAAQARVSFDQPAERIDVAVVGRGQRVPDDHALLRVELRRFDDRPRARASD